MANIQPRYNKDGKIISFSIRVFKGRDVTGKQLKPYSMTFEISEKWSAEKAEKEAQKAAILFEKECKEGVVADNKQTFAKYAQYVIDLKERNGLKHQTIILYKNLMKRINPAIGHIKLPDLRPQHLNKFYEQLSQDNMNLTNGKRLSDKTILEHHRLIRTILATAEKEMLVIYNAADKASPPKNKTKEAKYLEIDEIQRIFKILENEPLKWHVAVHLLAITGCRRGEILGLKWSKVNFKNQEIFIDNNLLYTKEKGIYDDSPKTKNSVRYIKIPSVTVQLLKKYKKYCTKLKFQLGSKWIGTDDYIFTQENGLPAHPDSLTDYCKKLELKYNIDVKKENENSTKEKNLREIKLSPHIFRHSQASILIFMGVDPVTVSKRLGHAQVSTTSDIYSHIMKKADEGASNVISKILFAEK